MHEGEEMLRRTGTKITIPGLQRVGFKNAQMLKSHMLHGNTTIHISLTGSTLQPRYPHEQPPASNHFCSVNVD